MHPRVMFFFFILLFLFWMIGWILVWERFVWRLGCTLVRSSHLGLSSWWKHDGIFVCISTRYLSYGTLLWQVFLGWQQLLIGRIWVTTGPEGTWPVLLWWRLAVVGIIALLTGNVLGFSVLAVRHFPERNTPYLLVHLLVIVSQFCLMLVF